MNKAQECDPRTIMIAAPEATAHKLRAILATAGYSVVAVCVSGAEAIASAKLHMPGLLVLTYRLSDMSGAELIEAMGEIGGAILITPGGEPAKAHALPDYVVSMQNPLNKDAFLQAVSVLLRMGERMLRLGREVSRLERTLAERKLIDRAKGRLMDMRRMSEAEAHHCMQKMSMDSGKPLADVAREILEEKMAV